MQNKTRTLTTLAILSAITVVISFFPLPMFGLRLTLSMVPVGIGAILFGKKAGAYLGGVFGMTSFIQCLGADAFGVTLFGISPVMTFLTCVPTRILAGFLCGLLFELLKKNDVSLFIAGISAPIFNTLLFMSVFMAGFWNTDFVRDIAANMNILNPLLFVVAFVGINGVVEIIAAGVLTFPIAKALKKAFNI